MTNQQHPITPPYDLVQQLLARFHSGDTLESTWAIAAQWGADQELEACCLLLNNGEYAASYGCHDGTSLRAARRPRPPSLKEQAMCALIDGIARGGNDPSDIETIRRALEALPE